VAAEGADMTQLKHGLEVAMLLRELGLARAGALVTTGEKQSE